MSVKKLNKEVGKLLAKYPEWSVEFNDAMNCNVIEYQETNFVVFAIQPEDDMPPVLTVGLIINIDDADEQPLESLNEFNANCDEIKVALLFEDEGASLAFSTSVCKDFIADAQLARYVHWAIVQLLGALNKGIEAGMFPSIHD